MSIVKGTVTTVSSTETVGFIDIFAPEMIEAVSPTYPRWIKRQIKRKYGKHPAIYMEIWIPFEPKLYDLIPKRPWKDYKFNTINKNKVKVI